MNEPARRALGTRGLLAAAVLLGACGEPERPHEPDRIGKAPARALVIVLDAAAASHFAWSGYPRQTTPRLDARVAERGFLFSNAHGATASVLPSAIVTLTGRHLPGPAEGLPRYRVPEGAPTLPGIFRAAGFETIGLSESPLVHEDYGFREVFHRWRWFPGLRAIKSVHPRPRNHPATRHLLGEAGTWIRRHRDQRWLSYLHIMRPHTPYFGLRPYEGIYTGLYYMWSGSALTEVGVRHAEGRASPDTLRYFTDLYDENLTSVDAAVMDLIEALEEDGALEDTLVVVTSGHGEAFLEHGHLYHDVSVYDEVTRMPLLFLPPPGLEIAPGRSDARVGALDLMPTLLDLFRLERPAGLPGDSLAPLMRGGSLPADRTLVSRTGDGTRFAFAREGRKLILHVDPASGAVTGEELYDLAADPGEQDDLAPGGAAAAALREYGERHVARVFSERSAPNGPLDETRRYELEVMGYLELQKLPSRGL